MCLLTSFSTCIDKNEKKNPVLITLIILNKKEVKYAILIKHLSVLLHLCSHPPSIPRKKVVLLDISIWWLFNSSSIFIQTIFSEQLYYASPQADWGSSPQGRRGNSELPAKPQGKHFHPSSILVLSSLAQRSCSSHCASRLGILTLVLKGPDSDLDL